MRQENTHEEYPRHSQGYAEDLYLAEHYPERDYNGYDQNSVCYAV